jgi:Helix-turn-helix domain
MSNATLKQRRVDAGISRKVAAEACGISQFRLDRIERGAVTDADVIKTYSAGLEQLLKSHTLAPHKPAAPKAGNGNGTKPAAKTTTAKTSTTKKATNKPPAKKTTTRKAAQPKPEVGE